MNNTERHNMWEYEQQRTIWVDERLKEVERINDILKNPNIDETTKAELNKSISLVLNSMNNPVLYVPLERKE